MSDGEVLARFRLEFPDPILSPNKHVHWRVKDLTITKHSATMKLPRSWTLFFNNRVYDSAAKARRSQSSRSRQSEPNESGGPLSLKGYLVTEWTSEEEKAVRELYATSTREEIAAFLGKTKASVRSYCYRHGLNTKKPQPWTFLEDEKLRRWMADKRGKLFDLDKLADYMGRSRWGVAMRISRLGLGDFNRVKPEGRKDRRKFKGDSEALKKHMSQIRKELIVKNGHPRGFLGGHHTDEARRSIGEKARAWSATVSRRKRLQIIAKSRGTKMAKYGTLAPTMKSSNAYSRARGGKREDLNNQYFRSSWEANYARYLNWLKAQGEIKDWQFEPETFYFEGVRRGAISYTPDFKIFECDGRIVYHEVKGWMDSKSKTKLKRMKKYYPDIEVVVIGEKEYRGIAQFSALIPNWECGSHGW